MVFSCVVWMIPLVREKTAVKSTLVRTIAIITNWFLILLFLRLRADSLRIAAPLLFFIFIIMLLSNPEDFVRITTLRIENFLIFDFTDFTVFYVNHPVTELRQRLIVGNHDNRLMKLFSGQFQKPQNFLRRLTVQISGRFIGQND